MRLHNRPGEWRVGASGEAAELSEASRAASDSGARLA